MVSPPPNDQVVEDFWKWFSSIAPELEKDFDNEALLSELDERVATMGDWGWEVGPGVTARSALVISPDGVRELLPVARSIVSRAPHVVGWDFLCARPAREECCIFAIKSSNGADLSIDARSWRYVLFKYPDDIVELLLEQGSIACELEDDQYTAAVVLLDGLLGEEARLLSISHVEVTVSLPTEHAMHARPIRGLPEHLAIACKSLDRSVRPDRG